MIINHLFKHQKLAASIEIYNIYKLFLNNLTQLLDYTYFYITNKKKYFSFENYMIDPWHAVLSSSKALTECVPFSPLPKELLYIQDFTAGAQRMFDEPHQEFARCTSPRLIHNSPKTQGQSPQE